MLRTLLSWFSARLGRGDGDEDTDTRGESGFIGSRLDASVLFAHGKSNDAEREISNINEQARLYEELGREK